ncbi:MAG: DUF4340 domain-containing protein [Deltaproteobacteria bacterium]|nr:DUF4340 domain-containing protein [Deltaproteobacteria bacterium]
MKARSRTAAGTLALLAAAAAALLYAWYGVDRRGEEEGKRKEAEEKVLAFDTGQVKALRIEAGGAVTSLTRAGAGGAGWRIEGLGEAADGGAVEGLLSRLAGLRRKAEVAARPDAAALASSGLAPPRGRIELDLEDGRRLAVSLGEPSGFDGSLPVRAGEGPVLLVDAGAEWALLRKTDDLRDRALLRFEPGKVQRVRLLAGGRVAWEAARRPGVEGEAAGWDLTAPRAAPADAGRVESTLRAASALRALRFADGAGRAREAGLEPPARTLVLLGEGGSELGRVELGKEANDSRFARSSAGPRILEVDRGAAAAVAPSVEELVERPKPPPAGPKAEGQ